MTGGAGSAPGVHPPPEAAPKCDGHERCSRRGGAPIPGDVIDDGKAIMEGRPVKVPPPDAPKGESKDGGRGARVAPAAAKESWAPPARRSGTMGIPRSEMPQIMSEHRGALVNYLGARGIKREEVTVPTDSLKPTQREFSRAKVDQAKGRTGGDRAGTEDDRDGPAFRRMPITAPE